MTRRSWSSLALLLLLALVPTLLELFINVLSAASPNSVPMLRLLQQLALPALGVLIVVLLLGQGLLYFMERPGQRRWTARRPPYPGLEPFSEEDAGVFFGRDAETAELVARLSPAVAHDAQRFIAVVGPSGSGKSSLVHAGLIPALTQRRRRWVVVPPMTPEDEPVRNLARSLAQELPGVRVEALAAQLASEPGALPLRLEELRAARGGRLATVLLVVDQAEDLLTLTPPAERDAFLELLRGALARQRWLWVVAAVRSEFLSGFLSAGFTDLFRQPVVIGAPGRAALFDMIERPAAQAGTRFEPGLVSRMVDDTGGGDALPLLAYTLQALYLRAGPGGTVTAQDYQLLGGVAGALADQADRVAAGLGGVDAVVSTLMRFVAMGERGPVRRSVASASLTDVERRVVDAFIGARLLTSDADAVQMAHEELFRRWPPLRQAVDSGAETLRQQAQVERWAHDWVRSGRRDSYLLTGERLELARRWHDGRAAPPVHEFLEHSARLDRAAMERLGLAIALRAEASLDRDPELALLLARAAVEECPPTPIAARVLLAATVNPCLRVVRGHGDGLWDLSWSPDGRRLVTSSEDRTARVWEAGTGRPLLVLSGHDDGVLGVNWSPDGTRIATCSRDRTVRIWDAGRGVQLATLTQDARPRGVVWSPDGRSLAVPSENGTTCLWDARERRPLRALRGHGDWVRDAAWSPGGERIATVSRDRTVRVWDAVSGIGLAVLRGHSDAVLRVAWSPDGRWLATAGHDGTARLWDVAAGAQRLVLEGHEDAVRGVAWSPAGDRLLTSADDRTARIWDPAGACLVVLRGHESSVRMAAWSPSGPRLATVSEDRTARLWEVDDRGEPAVLRGHLSTVQAAAWSPEGRRLATASRDRTARVWDAEAGAAVALLAGHEGTVRAVAWASEGRRVATAGEDRTARIWDAERGAELVALRGHDDAVRGVAWAPDGRRVATAAEDRTARIWDAASGEELAALRGHRDQVRAVAWSGEGRRVVTVSRDRTGRVWDVAGGSVLAELRGHDATVRGVAWSPEGRRLATVADDDTIRVWDAESGRPLAVLRGHESWVRCVVWSPDGRRLATASADRTVRTWDAERGAELAIVGLHPEFVEAVAWSPEGRRLASGSRDGTVRIWSPDRSLARALARARRRTARELTPAQRREAMLPEG